MTDGFVDPHGVPAYVSLRDAVRAAGVPADPGTLSEATLRAVCGSDIEVDDIRLAARMVIDPGPNVLVDSFHHGTGWAGLAERVAPPMVAVGSPDDRAVSEVLCLLHACAGAAPMALVRESVVGEADTAIGRLATAGCVRVVPADGAGGARVASTLSGVGTAAAMSRAVALTEGPQIVVEYATRVDRWAREHLLGADRASVVQHRRSLRVALDRCLDAGQWTLAADIAGVLTPAVADVGLHRAVHRRLRDVLGRIPRDDVAARTRLGAVSARLHLESGDLALSRGVAEALSRADSDRNDDLRETMWSTAVLDAVWHGGVPADTVTTTVSNAVRDGGCSAGSAARALVDLAARELRDARDDAAVRVLDAAGVHVAVAGEPLLDARLHVLEAMCRARAGSSAAAERAFESAVFAAAPFGSFAVVNAVTACLAPVRATSVAASTAALASVLDLIEGVGLAVDRGRHLSAVYADLGRLPDRMHDESSLTGGSVVEVLVGLMLLPAQPVADLPAATMRPPSAAAPDRTGPVPEPLTAREQEVAELVADGLTNVAIGRRLGITRWTVVSHMRSIMRKWECSSRVEVALLQRSARDR